MSQLEHILENAAKLGNPSTKQSRELSEDLYRTVMTAEPPTQRGLLSIAPRLGQAADGWHWNNLHIAPPDPRQVVGQLEHSSELDALVESAARDKRTVKCVGDGWGMSSIAEARDILILMAESFDTVIPPVGEVCRAAGGVRVAKLNEALHTAERALSNAPGFPGLTFAGCISAGGHGSGLSFGPLAEQVRAIELLTVDPAGRAVRQQVTREHPFFPAVSTSVGALGIITELTIEVESAYYIAETRRYETWDDVKGELPELLRQQRDGRLHSAEIWINPYPVRGRIRCVVGTRRKTTGPAKGERGWAITHGDRDRFVALSAVMRTFPHLIPQLLDGGLSLTTADDVVMPAAEGLDFGSTNLAPVLASECAIDLDDLVPTVDRLLRGIQRRAELDGRWVTSPIGLRFVSSGSAWLSPAHGRETCTIELPELLGTPHARETLEWFLRTELTHGRPHWGQYNPLSAAEIRERYPRDCTANFCRALEALDPLGIFANDFTRELRSAWGEPPQRLRVAGSRALGAAHSNCVNATVRSYSGLFCDPSPPLQSYSSSSDVLERLRTAKQKGQHYTLRAGGHALHTQALRRANTNDDYLSLQSPDGPRIEIDEERGLLTVSADATWHAVVHETLPRGFLPKIVVTGPRVTVGGTLASNSIGQGCRLHGHEADTVISVTVALPGSAGEEPQVRTLSRPGPADSSEDAQLFRAILRGYGQIGVILSAQYELMRVPPDRHLPSLEQCHGRGDPDAEGERCVAVTDVEAFAPSEIARALNRLVPSAESQNVFRAGVLFKTPEGWAPRVTSTRFESGRYGRHLVTYEGDSPARRVAESLLSTMPTAYVAGRVAAKVTEQGARDYRDPACGYLFTMLANETYKEELPEAVRAAVVPTAQMTYVLPEPRAVDFLHQAFDILRLRKDATDKEAVTRSVNAMFQQPDVKNWFVGLANETRQLEREQFGDTRSGALPSPEQSLVKLLSGVLTAGSLIPALFEMVWVPADHHLLSASYGQPGFAISLAFQGPGVNRDGFLERFFPFSLIAKELYRALGQLSDAAVELGGAVHLTKNVFVGENPRAFVSAMLGDRLRAFSELRDRFDGEHVLTSAFVEDVLGL